VFPARHHETNGSQATRHFLSGINRRERMRMKPRGARRGRDEHDDGPYEAVKHAGSAAIKMPLNKPSQTVFSADSRMAAITISWGKQQRWYSVATTLRLNRTGLPR
jgi:hypothetical protein